MPNAETVLFVGAEETLSGLIAAVSGGRAKRMFTAETVATPEAAAARARAHRYIAVVLDAEGATPDALLDGVRTVVSSGAPAAIVVVSSSEADDLDLKALRAGADDFLLRDRIDAAELGRAIDFAIERTRFDLSGDRSSADTAPDADLGAICGPSAVPTTERSFGAAPLRQSMPADFDAAIRGYAELLDRAFEARIVHTAYDTQEHAAAIADRLGMLGAGPRDVVELHKTAIALSLVGKPPRKARAYANEGRILLLQVMGHLVSFYRNLSWNRSRGGRVAASHVQPVARPKPKSGKHSR